LSEDARLDVLAAAMPLDPAQLWDPEALIESVAAAWIDRVGRRTRVPEDLIVQMRSAFDLPLQAQTLLAICADAAQDPRLNGDGLWEISASPFPSLIRRDAESRAVFDDNVLRGVALVVPWLF